MYVIMYYIKVTVFDNKRVTGPGKTAKKTVRAMKK
jgi:hypothetical protein